MHRRSNGAKRLFADPLLRENMRPKFSKFAFLLLPFLLNVSCSGKTDSATESTTSSIDASTNTLQTWIKDIQNDEAFLHKLNQFNPKDLDASSLSQWCSDKDVLAAIQHANPDAVISDGDIENALSILRDIPNHGADFKPAHLDEIEKLYASFTSIEPKTSFSWLPEDAATLEKSLKNISFNPQSNDAASQLAELLKGAQCESILPRYCKFAQKQTSNLLQNAENNAKLEALLACDLTAWAGVLRLNYPDNDYAFDRFRKFVNDDVIVSLRKQNFVADMIKRGVQPAFQRITPPDPQYELLKKARKIYVDAIESGGWPSVHAPKTPKDPVLGKSYDYVPELRKRLIAEGYNLNDDASDIFDDNLQKAVATYRDVHQLSDKKLVDSVLFRNLTVSPEKRLETIDLALQKYREQAIGSLFYYVQVNVPDFHVEVWRDKKRLARHRIIVGNNKMQRDPITKQPVPDPETLYPIYPNRTPLQTSKINEIIFNPYWNVPPRIRIEELEPKLAENPNYYIENNYEEVNVDNPKLYYVRELPNPKNSLGKVKFMYPNPHNTYLHDTPAKAAFKNTIRALSHGCMRVQDPLDFAQILLSNDGQWDKKKIDEILNADPPQQTPIDLIHPVDIDVIYIDARVDDSGVVAFLSDVYEFDAIRLGHITPKKLPKPKN